MIIKFSHIFLIIIIAIVHLNTAATVTEVQAGQMAVLPCVSNDDDHLFMFWQLSDDQQVIGPGNEHDIEKYNYEVLTGQLFIRGVSSKEQGFYKCVSRGINDQASIKVHVIELVVKKDNNEIRESNFETNLLRGMAGVSVVVVGIALVLLYITMKKKRNQRFFDLEESRENSPARYNNQSRNQLPTVAGGPSLQETGGIDNMGLDVDFPRVFKQMQKEQALH